MVQPESRRFRLRRSLERRPEYVSICRRQPAHEHRSDRQNNLTEYSNSYPWNWPYNAGAATGYGISNLCNLPNWQQVDNQIRDADLKNGVDSQNFQQIRTIGMQNADSQIKTLANVNFAAQASVAGVAASAGGVEEAAVSTSSSSQAQNLSRQLTSEEQMGEAVAGEGNPILGADNKTLNKSPGSPINMAVIRRIGRKWEARAAPLTMCRHLRATISKRIGIKIRKQDRSLKRRRK